MSALNKPTQDKMMAYRAAAQARQQQRHKQMCQRQQMGMHVAHRARNLLKETFNAERVVLFGSMLSVDRVHERSDVDLAVWGLNPKDYYRAVGQLQGLDPSISVDLVEAESAPPRLLRVIEDTGMLL